MWTNTESFILDKDCNEITLNELKIYYENFQSNIINNYFCSL